MPPPAQSPASLHEFRVEIEVSVRLSAVPLRSIPFRPAPLLRVLGLHCARSRARVRSRRRAAAAFITISHWTTPSARTRPRSLVKKLNRTAQCPPPSDLVVVGAAAAARCVSKKKKKKK